MPRLPGKRDFVSALAALLLLGAVGCDGSASEDVELGEHPFELGAKAAAPQIKKLARNFRVTAEEPFQLLTRAGEIVVVPLSELVVELELAPAPVAATARRAPVLVSEAIPPVPGRRAPVVSTFTAEIPCSGVATRAPVPVPAITFPDVPPTDVPRAMRVPAMVVTPTVAGMPVVASRARVPVQSVEATAETRARGRGGKPSRKRVLIPEITIGLIDASAAVPTAIEVQIPDRSFDERSFHAVRAVDR